MRKDSRLSFRITEEISQKIDRAIEKAPDQLRDRSEFGNKAIKFYLDYIENAQATKEIMLEAVVALAKETGVTSDEIEKVRTILEERTMYPEQPISGLDVEKHPLIEEISEIRKQLDREDKDKLDRELMSAHYNEVEKIFKKYRGFLNT